VLQVLHWFNPVLWFAFALMRADRELATDGLALAHARESENVPYGETILKVLEGFLEVLFSRAWSESLKANRA
jgi:bla regulator protein BlaR1